MPKNNSKFQMVMDKETQTLINELKGWTSIETTTGLIKLGLKELHWRIGEQRKGKQIVSQDTPPGVTVFDSLTVHLRRSTKK